jgi:hypothetical protein
MPPGPFLPALLFAFAALLWPAAAHVLPARWKETIAARAPWVPRAAPWVRSAGLPYLALLTGFVSAQDFGLMGGAWWEWLAGIALALVLGFLLGGCLASRTDPPPVEAQLLDEARWTLYRAVCWPLMGNVILAVLAGLLAGLLERGLDILRKRETFAWKGKTPFFLRIASSALLFLAAHNFLLALGMYAFAKAVRHPGFPAPWNKQQRG